jgi:hypothetical protein
VVSASATGRKPPGRPISAGTEVTARAAARRVRRLVAESTRPIRVGTIGCGPCLVHLPEGPVCIPHGLGCVDQFLLHGAELGRQLDQVLAGLGNLLAGLGRLRPGIGHLGSPPCTDLPGVACARAGSRFGRCRSTGNFLRMPAHRAPGPRRWRDTGLRFGKLRSAAPGGGAKAKTPRAESAGRRSGQRGRKPDRQGAQLAMASSLGSLNAQTVPPWLR